MKLYFATTNQGKLPSAIRVFARHGIEVVQADIDIPEIQAETAEAVAREKARYAAERLGGQVIVVDSAFHIAALNGFPGTNVKWATKQIGLDGYLRLMAHLPEPEQRGCWFEDAIASAPYRPTVIVRQTAGTLAKAASGPDRPGQKSPLWRLFVPEGGNGLTLAEMKPEDLEEFRQRASSERAYESMAEWIAAGGQK
jgi:non-canonical purine NTP pyrophosphatase (RdgB/HAM1 family)